MTQVNNTQNMILLKNLKLTSRFLFDVLMEDPEVHKDVLTIIFQKEVGLLDKNQVEKQLQTAPFLKSVRLDVFAMDENNNIFNTEMQDSRKSDLRKRSRFYQALIDSGLLPVGSINYNQLNDSYIIMITPFDIFGLGLYQYTFESTCKERPDLKIEDGATRIFLNTKGTNPEEVSKELVEFLEYVEKTDDETAEKAESELVKKIHKRVQEIKSSEEMGVRFMQLWEEKQYERLEALEEGREEGELRKEIILIIKKLEKNLPANIIAEHLEEPKEFVEKVCKVIQENPETDVDEIVNKIKNV